MFQSPRNPFHLPHLHIHRAESGPAAPPVELAPHSERHPAMRGLNVSPVHGRHCICDRCGQHKHAA
jgi:hypothetical protein